jgi:hypothetical protein
MTDLEREKERFPSPPVRCIRCGKGYWLADDHECTCSPEEVKAAQAQAEEARKAIPVHVEPPGGYGPPVPYRQLLDEINRGQPEEGPT